MFCWRTRLRLLLVAVAKVDLRLGHLDVAIASSISYRRELDELDWVKSIVHVIGM